MNIIAMSQGAQDGRYMLARLPVSDDDPSLGMMRDKVATFASVVGENEGALGASLLLDAAYVSNVLAGDGWGDYARDIGWEKAHPNVEAGMWRSDGKLQLLATARPDETDFDELDLYRSYMQSLTNLSRKYMLGYAFDNVNFQESWSELISFVGEESEAWGDIVNASNERDNGVAYYSWAAKIRNWNYDDWGNGSSPEAITFFLAWSLLGSNDGYTTVNSQRLDRLGYPNTTHVTTLAGSWLGRGYHHMYFTGRNDATLASPRGYRARAPYNGGSADFYEQLARHLADQGF